MLLNKFYDKLCMWLSLYFKIIIKYIIVLLLISDILFIYDSFEKFLMFNTIQKTKHQESTSLLFKKNNQNV